MNHVKKEENNRMEKTRDVFKNIRDTKGAFHESMGTIKDRNSKELQEAEKIKKRWKGHTEKTEIVRNYRKQKKLRRDGKDTQKNSSKKILMTQITTMVWLLTQSQTSWSVKLSGPYETSLQTK